LPERHGDDEVAAWLEAEGVSVRVPGAGREAKLVELALKNARRNVGRRDECGMLADALEIDSAWRIEGFDVSHAQGKAAVGSNVTFVDGSAEKSDYRRKKLTDQNDDYDNMRALLEWRASRAVEERDDRPDPDLLLIDGGEGQLEAACDALEAVDWDVPAVALRESRGARGHAPPNVLVAERRAAPAPPPARARRGSPLRRAVPPDYSRRGQDGVRRRAGVGPETRKQLLGRFGSVENVRHASLEDLRSVEGSAKRLPRRLNLGYNSSSRAYGRTEPSLYRSLNL